VNSIVFVHGFNGHPKSTWFDMNSGFYWPYELRNVISKARVMTFGYDARIQVLATKNLMGIHDHAVNLLGRLRNERATFPVRTTSLPRGGPETNQRTNRLRKGHWSSYAIAWVA
jgi:hypothetical protein